MKATPEFQDRYLECVVERIYYVVNRADNNKLSLCEIQKSNLVNVLSNVGEEPDINQILDYFSYEHFYVCYCKFWELDADHVRIFVYLYVLACVRACLIVQIESE